MPAVTPTPLSAGRSRIASSTAIPHGTLVGIIMGCVIFFIMTTAASYLVLARYLAVHKGKSGPVFDLFTPRPKTSPLQPQPVGYWGPPIDTLSDPHRIARFTYLGPQPGQTYEIAGSHGYEMTGDETYPPGEIGGRMLPRELLASVPKEGLTSIAELDVVGTTVERAPQSGKAARERK